MILKYDRETWPVSFSFPFFCNCKALFLKKKCTWDPKKEEFVSILNEISISSGILTWWHLPVFPSSEKSEYLEWEGRIYFYNKFSDYWNVGMPAKVSALISRNLWLLAWKMKEDQPSAEPHRCGWAQSSVLTIIKGNKCSQCLGTQSNPRMSSAAQFLNHQDCFFHSEFEYILFLNVTPRKVKTVLLECWKSCQ